MTETRAAEVPPKPKPGDRFIHARFLADGAKPPYDTEESFAVHVVTATRTSRGGSVTVFHTAQELWDAGHRNGQWTFQLAFAGKSVRRWLQRKDQQNARTS